MVYPRGINGTQKNNEQLCSLIQKAGKNCGVPIGRAGFYPGANDADAFSRYGIKAAGLCGVRHKPSKYYHTRFDGWDNLDMDCVEKTRLILREAVRYL